MTRGPTGIVPVIAIDRRAATPLYQQIYEAFRDAIVERRLRAGQRLPSSRTLAVELHISRLPVLNAFEQLIAEGYFETRVGAGTFVARSLPDEPPPTTSRTGTGAAAGAGRTVSGRSASRTGTAGPGGGTGAVPFRTPGRRLLARHTPVPPREDEPWLKGSGAFRVSQPAVDRFPFQIWSRLIARHGRNPSRSLLAYGDPMGHRPFREAIAAYLRTARAVRCEADQIMVVSGSQQAIEMTARVLLDPRSRVWVEDPGYRGAHDVLRLAGAQPVPVPVDDEGLDVAAGIRLCRQARAAYVTPSHQYPLGMTMSAARRLQLLDWAHRSGAWIIEDDYDSEYRYGTVPVAALQGLDRDARVIYLGTFSKVLFPALRLGYLVLPADLVPRFAAVRESMDLFPPTLYQAVLTDFITEGHFARHVRRMRLLYRERRDALVDAIERELGGGVQVRGGHAGTHLVAILPRGSKDRRVSEEAARRGLWVMPLSTCYAPPSSASTPPSSSSRSRASARAGAGGRARRLPGLVLGYGGTNTADIADAVRRLRPLLLLADEPPDHAAQPPSTAIAAPLT